MNVKLHRQYDYLSQIKNERRSKDGKVGDEEWNKVIVVFILQCDFRIFFRKSFYLLNAFKLQDHGFLETFRLRFKNLFAFFLPWGEH